MKKLLLFIGMLVFMQVSFAQPWIEHLPKGKEKGENYTLFDYQKAFKSYCDNYLLTHPKNVFNQNPENGEFGIPGYSQFKRWEYYWKTRVDNKTGEFPNTTAWEVWQDYKKTIPDYSKSNVKSQSGAWTSLGPANLDREDYDGALQENGTGRLNCMTFDPNDDNHFWVGAPAGGVWESLDGGATWSCLTDDNPIIGVSAIALPSNYNKTTNPTIYIATGDRDAVDDPSIGVLKSTDGGATWNTTGLTFSASANTRIGGLVCSPTDPNTIVAATFQGIYKSTDGGATWTNTQAGLFIDMDLIPGTNTLIATTIATVEAHRSTDFGSTWTNTWTGTPGANGEYRCDVATTGASTSIVYLITDDYDNSAMNAIYKSVDAGVTFTQVYDAQTDNNLYGWDATNTNGDGGQGWYDVAFAVSNTDPDIVYVGGVNGYISTDGAVSFTVCNGWAGYVGVEVVHADHHNAYFRPSDDRLFDVNDGGVYYSDNVTSGSTAKFTEITDGIITGQIYDLGISQNTDGYIIAGFQDNGTKLLQPSGGIYGWNQVKGGDGMCCAIDPVDYNMQWGTYVQLQVDRTTNLWGSASSLRNSGGAAWAGPLEVDPQGTALYIGTDAVEWDASKSVAGGAKPPSSFSDLSQSLDATSYLSALDIFNDGTDKMIWTASPAGCWKSPLGGSGTYTAISGLPSNAVTDIAIDEDDYNHVYVCFGGFDSNSVYETFDGGATWTDISAGLPAVPTGAIVINEANTTKNEVYVGTDAGIYVKLGTAPWQLFNTGMPFVSITDLEIYYGGTAPVLYAATYGRGIWSSDCYDPPALDLAIAEIVEPVTEYCDPGTFIPTVTISNIGTTTITSATIEYSIDGGTAVSQNWSGSLAQGASTNVTFSAVTLVLGSHTIEYTITSRNGNNSDDEAINDSKSGTFALWNHDMPYTQDFDAFTLGGNSNAYDGSTVALSECWVNETGDDMDWSVNSGSSPSGGTGPTGDHTSGSGVYLYTETSNGNNGKIAKVSSPVIDLTNYTNTQATFWYHMYSEGGTMGTLTVDVFYNGTMHDNVSVDWDGSPATSITGDQGNQWLQATIDLSAADGANDLVVTFDATTGSDYQGDMAIDDFSVTGTTGSCTYPTTQATSFTAIPSTTSINVGWTSGNGDAVLVVARDGSAVNTDPTDGTSYTANTVFGSGDQIGTGNYVVFNGTGASVNVTGLTSGNTYYFAIYEYSSTGNCYKTPALTGNSTTTVVTFDWTGNAGNDWFNTGNWSSSQIPSASDDATIPGSLSNYPIINNGVSNIAVCNNLTIDAGASVTIDTDGYMTVNGAITNNAGNTGLVINSDATGTGSLIQNSTAGVDATVNCYLDATTRQWHMISSPIAAAPLTVLPSSNNLYYYDESTADYWTGTTNDAGSILGWTAPAGNMNVAQGYLFNYYANTVTYTGQLNTSSAAGAIAVPYTNNGVDAPNGANYDDFDGWNLIGNPFTSAIDWDDASVAHAAANLNDAVYTYDDAVLHNYTSYVGGVGTNGGTQYIPAMQGFFVKGDATETGGTLNIGAAARVHNAQGFWKESYTTPDNFIRLQISANGYTDETVVRFLPEATDKMDNGLDAYKLYTMDANVPQVCTKSAAYSTEYSINTFKTFDYGTYSVPLRTFQTGDNYTISVTEFNFTDIKVYLKDNLNNTTTELNLNGTVNLAADVSDAADRFELVFEKSNSGINITESNVSVYPNPTNGKFYIIVKNKPSRYSVKVINVTGQKILEKKLNDTETNVLDLTNKPAGIYFVEITFNDNYSIIKKIVKE